MTRVEGGLRSVGQVKTGSAEQPLVTMITVAYNARDYIGEAINSVLSQTYSNVEYIVIDGGSSDGTLDIVRWHEDAIDYWLSEPDEGIYNAMNKGISLARGDIIGLLNADDVLYPAALECVASELVARPEAGFTMAPVELAREDGAVFGVASPLTDDEISGRMYQEMPCPHQGVFVRRAVYESLGAFDERYRLRADYDFLLRLL